MQQESHAKLFQERLVFIPDNLPGEHGRIYVNVYGVGVGIIVVNGKLEETFYGAWFIHQLVDSLNGRIGHLVAFLVELTEYLLSLTCGGAVGNGRFSLGGKGRIENR